jgi:hypothetical protein
MPQLKLTGQRPVTAESITATSAVRYQAITTSYRGATDNRGSRVIATCEAGYIAVSWDHDYDAAENHARAALVLFQQMGWDEHATLAMGGTGDGYVFVQIPKPR